MKKITVGLLIVGALIFPAIVSAATYQYVDFRGDAQSAIFMILFSHVAFICFPLAGALRGS